MSVLLPYMCWLRSLQGDQQLEWFLADADGEDRADLSSPAYQAKASALNHDPKVIRSNRALLRDLRAAKRFVLGTQVELNPVGDSPIDYSCRRELVRNPHLPHPLMYIQLELCNDELDGKNFFAMWLLREHGERNFSGTWAMWYPKRRLVFQAPAEMTFEGESSRIHRLLGDRAVERRERNSCEFLGQLAMTFVDCVNNHERDLRFHGGQRLVGAGTKLRNSTRLEYQSLINIDAPSHVGPSDPDADGARKREHDVRGHWRHLRNGRVTWVRSHRRGDASLGRVDSEYQMRELDHA